MKTSVSLSFVFIILFTVCFTKQLRAQRIRIDGTRFVVGGKEIVMNGVNTPWDNWNDFGGNYNSEFWDNELHRVKESGGNCMRVWISCNGEEGILIDSVGFVSGATNAHWRNLDDLFDLAETHKVYIMATMLSFDHTKNSHDRYMHWRRMIENKMNVRSYINFYLKEFIERYKKNPYLWSIDACNEIEWMNQDSVNAQFSWDKLQYLVASMAAAVHLNSEILFTLGSAAVKWNSDLPAPFEGNRWSDINLQQQIPSPMARLDFYSPHYYGWVVKHFGNFCIDRTPADYGLNDRPCMVGENPATGVFTQLPNGNDSLVVSIDDAYIKAYENGWKGLLVWTSNGVDRYGSIDDCAFGLNAFFEKYPQLVNP
jgi:hypothetical protein